MRPMEVKLEESNTYDIAINYPTMNNGVDYIFKSMVSDAIVKKFLNLYEEEIYTWEEDPDCTETYFRLTFDADVTPKNRGLVIANELANRLHHDFYISKTSHDFFDAVISIEDITEWILISDDISCSYDVGNFMDMDIRVYDNRFRIKIVEEDTDKLSYDSGHIHKTMDNIQKTVIRALQEVYTN